jgi:ABC-type transport system involved in cytochrome c biogenesis ATPase subunit
LAARIGAHLAAGGMTVLTSHQDVPIQAKSTVTLSLSA